MRFKNGRHLDARIPESWGNERFVFWIEDCFDPRTYLVRGDNFSDAYDWFLCNERIERELRVEPEDLDADELEAVKNGDSVAGIGYNDNGTVLYTESVMGVELHSFVHTVGS